MMGCPSLHHAIVRCKWHLLHICCNGTVLSCLGKRAFLTPTTYEKSRMTFIKSHIAIDTLGVLVSPQYCK